MSAYDDRVIAEFRANGGQVRGFGSGLVLLHSTGARSGERRVSPVALRSSRRRPQPTSSSRSANAQRSPKLIRAWATDNVITVPARGRIRPAVRH